MKTVETLLVHVIAVLIVISLELVDICFTTVELIWVVAWLVAILNFYGLTFKIHLPFLFSIRLSE